jgi:predicted nucleic acid-binding protein
MGLKYLFDSNIILSVDSGRLPLSQILEIDRLISDSEVANSTITYIEAFAKINVPIKELISLHSYFKLLIELPLASQIAQITIEFRKNSKRKLLDCIVAASAYHHGLTLISLDQEFSKIDGLSWVTPDALLTDRS